MHVLICKYHPNIWDDLCSIWEHISSLTILCLGNCFAECSDMSSQCINVLSLGHPFPLRIIMATAVCPTLLNLDVAMGLATVGLPEVIQS